MSDELPGKTASPGPQSSDSILEPDDKILIAHRRLFQHDQPRFFVETVTACRDGIVKVVGSSWVREHVRGNLKKKKDPRIRIVPIASHALMIYQLPDELVIDQLELEHTDRNEIILTDNRGFSLDLTDRNQSIRTGG